MLIVLGVAGFVMLLAIIWCIRTMRKGFTSLSADKERWRERFTEEERRLSKEQSDIPASEQLHLLFVGVQDLLRLEEIANAGCVLEGSCVHVTCDGRSWLLSYHAREQKLQSMHKVLHGPSHWILERSGEGEDQVGKQEEFPSVAQLMQAFHAQLRGEEMREPSFLEARRKHHALQK